MRKMYLLIETIPEKAFEIAVSLRCRPHVKAADLVFGPYDIVAVVEAPDANATAKVTLCDIPNIDGIKRVITSPVSYG